MKWRNVVAGALAAVSSALLFCTAYAEEDGSGTVVVSTGRNYITVEAALEDGRSLGSAYYDPAADTVCMPMDALLERSGLTPDIQYDKKTGLLTATAEDFDFEACRGRDYYKVNYRYVYAPGGFFVIQGQPCFPAEALCRVFGYEQELSAGSGDLILRATGEGILTAGEKGEKYYILTYGNDNVKWLARIINAESEGEILAGKIGIGNVIMNRVDDIYFPNNIHDVIFHVDVDGTVQFETTQTGGINTIPSEEACVAAYLCFEGVNTVGISEFFVEPGKGDDSWFRNYLSFVVTIGNHDFYADPRRVS